MAHVLTIRSTPRPAPLLATVALAMLAGGALMIAANLATHAIPADCWPIDSDPGWESRGCASLTWAFGVAAGPARGLREVLAVLAPLVAIVIGVWSGVAADRWSRSRRDNATLGPWSALRPVVLAGAGVLLLLALLGAILGAALDGGREFVPRSAIASGGVAMLGRAAVVGGVAMLATVLARRPWAGVALALAVAAGWAFGVVPVLQGRIERVTARWLPAVEAGMRNGWGEYAVYGTDAFDLSRPGIAGEPGARMSEARYDRVLAACGPMPGEEDRGGSSWSWCTLRLSDDLLFELAAPADTAAAFAVGEMAVGLAAGAAVVGTAAVVLRRRARSVGMDRSVARRP